MKKYLKELELKLKKLWQKVSDPMCELYGALIIAGKKTYSQVPSLLKARVKEYLEAIGLEELVQE